MPPRRVEILVVLEDEATASSNVAGVAVVGSFDAPLLSGASLSSGGAARPPADVALPRRIPLPAALPRTILMIAY